jgi:hypothetical protein
VMAGKGLPSLRPISQPGSGKAAITGRARARRARWRSE